MVDKATLRKVYLEKRLFLSKTEYASRNAQLSKQLFTHIDFTAYRQVHSFLPIYDKKEVDTFSIISKARKINPILQIVVSKTLPTLELSHFILNESTELKTSRWGIPEPIKGDAASIDLIDLVLVPLITFDKHGHRIGYGKGYYDRFLKQVPLAKKIGLSLAPPLDTIQYHEAMDVKLDGCVTPYSYYSFELA